MLTRSPKFEDLPSLIKILIQLHELNPERFPKIIEPEIFEGKTTVALIDKTVYKFESNDKKRVDKWKIQGAATSQDHKWHILLTIINTIINDKISLINLYGFTFKFYFSDFLIAYVTKFNKKKMRLVLNEFDLTDGTINSYLRTKDIEKYVQKRAKNRKIKRSNHNNIRPISELLAKAWSLEHSYIVDNIVKDAGLYNRILNCINSKGITKLPLKYDDIFNHYGKVCDAIQKVNKRKLYKEIVGTDNSKIHINDFVTSKFYFLRNLHIDDPSDWTTYKITTTENGNLNFEEYYVDNIHKNASKEVYAQLVSQFTGNINIPIIIAGIPLRFDMKGFFYNYGFIYSYQEAKALMKLLKYSKNQRKETLLKSKNNFKDTLLGYSEKKIPTKKDGGIPIHKRRDRD